MPPKPSLPPRIVNPGEENVFFALLRNALEAALQKAPQAQERARLSRLIEQLREGIGGAATRSETRGGPPPYGYSDLGGRTQPAAGERVSYSRHSPFDYEPFINETTGRPYHPTETTRTETSLYDDLSRRGPAEAWIRDPKSREWRQLGPDEPLYPPGGKFPPFGQASAAGLAAGGAGAGALIGGLTQLPEDEPEDLRRQRIVAQALLAGEPVSSAGAMTPETGVGKVAEAQSQPQPGLVQTMLERGRGGLQQVGQGLRQIGRGASPSTTSAEGLKDVGVGGLQALLGAWEAVGGPIAEAAGRGSDALWRALQMPTQASQPPTGTPPRPAMPPLMGLPPPRTGAQGGPEERRQALRNIVEQLAFMGGPGIATRGAKAFGQGLEGLAASGGPVSRAPYGRVTLDPRSVEGGQSVLESALRYLQQISPAAYRRIKYDPREVPFWYRPRVVGGEQPTMTNIKAGGAYYPARTKSRLGRTPSEEGGRIEVYNAPSPLEMVRPRHPDEAALIGAEELLHAAQDLAGQPHRRALGRLTRSPKSGPAHTLLEKFGYKSEHPGYPWEMGAMGAKGLFETIAPGVEAPENVIEASRRLSPELQKVQSTLDYPQGPPMWRK